MAATTLKKPKALVTARGYTQWARLMASPEFDTDSKGSLVEHGWIPQPKNIPSPYRYSGDWEVYHYQGIPVVLAETSHRRFEVFRASDCV